MNSWKKATLNEISNLKYGENLPSTNLLKNGYPVYGANGIIGYFNKYNLEIPTVLVSCRGEYSGKINFSKAFSFVTNNSIPVRLSKDFIDSIYLNYFLQTIKKAKIVSGSAQPQVVINDLKRIYVNFPPLPHQRKIARILTTIDNVIETTDSAIARVNRTKGPKKTHGIVVDYFGVAQNLKEALAIYGDEDEKALKEFLEYFKDINKELPILESRYNRLIQLFEDKKIKQIKAFVNQEMEDEKEEFKVAEDCIELAEEVRFRAEFDTYLKSFFESLDLLFNVNQAKVYWIPAKRFGYLMMRIRNRYKDETLDLKWAGAKVRKLIDKHLESLGIDSKIPPVSLLSDKFPKELEKHSGKAKASEMEHAIRKHIKVNLTKDPELYTKFNERLKAIIIHKIYKPKICMKK